MTAFRKKPVVIDAVQWDGNNYSELKEFIGEALDVQWSVGGYCFINTLEGRMNAYVGDWIIRGVQGEFYPCKPDIFAATYEPASATAPLALPSPELAAELAERLTEDEYFAELHCARKRAQANAATAEHNFQRAERAEADATRLREALERIRDNAEGDNSVYWVFLIAREALSGGGAANKEQDETIRLRLALARLRDEPLGSYMFPRMYAEFVRKTASDALSGVDVDVHGDALRAAATIFRVARDVWLAKLDEEPEDWGAAGIDAMDTLYSYFRCHRLIEADEGESRRRGEPEAS